MEYFLVYNDDDELVYEEFVSMDELTTFMSDKKITQQYIIIEGELVEENI